MNGLFITFISLSLSGSIIAAILFLLKPIIRNRVSKAWQYYIWIIVLLRLIVPFSSQTSIVGDLFSHSNEIVAQSDIQGVQGNHLILADLNKLNNVRYNQNRNTVQNMKNHPGLINIKFAWFIVFTVLLVHKITSYNDFVRFIKIGRTRICDSETLNVFHQVCKDMNIQHTIELYENSFVPSPMLVGVFCPYIVLPNKNISENELYNTIAHEITHYRRFDSLYKWAAQLVVCIHWFNPIVYIIYKEICRQCELSCDEALIKNMDTDGKRRYGTTLVSSIRKKELFSDDNVSLSLNKDAKLLKERLNAIMNFKKASKCMKAVTMLLTLSVIFSSIVTGAYANDMSFVLTSQSNTTGNAAVSSASELSEIYGKYGITHNNDTVFYQGKQVQQFVDGGPYYQGGGFWCSSFYNDKTNNGSLYLHVVRGTRGQIEGIEPMKEDMLVQLFGQNNVLNYQPSRDSAGRTLEEMFHDYSRFGITYNSQTDKVFYNGEEVKAFVDGGSKYRDSGYWFNITYYNHNSDSVLYLHSIRNKDGSISGVDEMSETKRNDYYGNEGMLLSTATNRMDSIGQVGAGVETVFQSASLPQAPNKPSDQGDYYFYNLTEDEVQAVARWKNATGTFYLANFKNTSSENTTLTIAYEIKVYKGDFDFIHTSSDGTNVLIRENVNDASTQGAYDYNIFKFSLTGSTNNLAFVCNDADVDIRIIASLG